jgi:hypothetical protein
MELIMAHFAEIRSDNNEVLRIVVISNEDVNANGGELSTEAETFVSNFIPKDPVIAREFGGEQNYPATYWKQCSYNASFRGRCPIPGDLYNSSEDKFKKPQPYPSWVPNDKSSSPLYDYTEWMPPQGWFTNQSQLLYTENVDGADAEFGWNKQWNEERGLWTGTKADSSSDNNNYIFDYTTMSWVLDN